MFLHMNSYEFATLQNRLLTIFHKSCEYIQMRLYELVTLSNLYKGVVLHTNSYECHFVKYLTFFTNRMNSYESEVVRISHLVKSVVGRMAILSKCFAFFAKRSYTVTSTFHNTMNVKSRHNNNGTIIYI